MSTPLWLECLTWLLVVAIVCMVALVVFRIAEVDTLPRQPAPKEIIGWASWYGEDYRGKAMANGQPFDPDRLTAASWNFPLGTFVRVSSGHHEITVEITDRGPDASLFGVTRVIDLSRAAFERIAPLDDGLVTVAVTPVEGGPR